MDNDIDSVVSLLNAADVRMHIEPPVLPQYLPFSLI